MKRWSILVLLAAAGCTDVFGLHPVGELTSSGSGGEPTSSSSSSSGGATGSGSGGTGTGGSGGAAPAVKVVDFDLGLANGCAVVDTAGPANEVRCWGAAQYGVLGAGVADDIGDDAGEAPVVIPLVDASPIAVRVGEQHACALLEGGKVRCWGKDEKSQLGLSSLSSDLFFDDGIVIETLVVGGYFSCALSATKQIYCWGDNSSGQLGLPPGQSATDPVHVSLAGDPEIAGITAGYAFVCALLDDGSVHCWGDNSQGQCGHPPAQETIAPSEPPVIPNPFSVVLAGYHLVCGATPLDDLQCWGVNDNGQLGAETSIPASEIPLDTDLVHEVLQFAPGYRHGCAILDVSGSPTAKCWGAGNLGQRGIESTLSIGSNPGSMGAQIEAVHLPASFAPSRLVAGFDATCALSLDGKLTCWGDNENGRLGLGLPATEARGDEPGEMGEATLLVPFD